MKKLKAVMWSIESAGAEFQIDRRTLGKRLKNLGLKPDRKGLFTTKQIRSAAYGDLQLEKLREARLDADLKQRKMDVEDGKYLPHDDVSSVFNFILVNLRQKIVHNHKLTHEFKVELLADLRDLPFDEYLKGHYPAGPGEEEP